MSQRAVPKKKKKSVKKDMLNCYTYRFRLYPDKNQEGYFSRCFGTARWVYNHCLDKSNEIYKLTSKTSSREDMSSFLTEWKRQEETKWLNEIDSTIQQSAVKDLSDAFQHFYERCSDPSVKQKGFPKFKKKNKGRRSFRSMNNHNSIRLEDGFLRLPKVGLVKIKLHRQVSGRILNATVAQEPDGKYYVSLCCEGAEIPTKEHTYKEVGIDLNTDDFAVFSDGKKIPAMHALVLHQKKLRKLQRQLSRKPIGSKNWYKAKKKLAREHAKIANIRRDFLQKLSTSVINEYDYVFIEDLDVKSMLSEKPEGFSKEWQKSHARNIMDASWREFRMMLEYKAGMYNKTVMTVSQYYPSSQLCHCCGYKNPAIKNMKVRKYTCPKCGTHLDRDVNAAINICTEGMRLLKNKVLLINDASWSADGLSA